MMFKEGKCILEENKIFLYLCLMGNKSLAIRSETFHLSFAVFLFCDEGTEPRDKASQIDAIDTRQACVYFSKTLH